MTFFYTSLKVMHINFSAFVNIVGCCRIFVLSFSFEGNVRSPGAGGGPRGGPRRGRGGVASSAKRGKRPVPTAEQLDAELDAYVKEIK